MSWMKRPQGGAPPPPGPDQPPYSAPQQFGGQQNMYGNYQGGTPGNAPLQQVWGQVPPQQQPQYNQQYGQVYQQPEYAGNANQYYQQPVQPAQYTQGYNQTYNSAPQPGYQQNYYPNQGVQQNYPPNKDSWEDNWGDWGWEDSSKQGPKPAGPNPAAMTGQQAPPPQQQVFNNANVIAESFATTDSWNWSMEDKKEAADALSAPAPVQENSQVASLPIQNTADNNIENDVNTHSQRSPSSNSTNHPNDDVKTLNDRDVVKERLPNLALGKRFHLDNLTPQWSIESQMSQESSDGPQTYSEGTYRSENQSRNSSKSSPGLNTENSNFNYSQAGIEELYPPNTESSKQSVEEPTIADRGSSHNSRRESHDELSNSLQEMSISNSENPAPDTLEHQDMELRHSHDNVGVPPLQEAVVAPLQPPPSVSPPSQFPPYEPTNQPLPASSSSHTMGSALPPVLPLPTSSSASLPPPSNFPPPMSSQNPFKHAGAFSHKNLPKPSSGNSAPMQPFPPQMSSSNLTSPSVVNKVSQHNRGPVGFGANLETTPDNSERPDQPQVAPFRPMTMAPPVPDNLEVAPRNDRNEYLQTAHLSSGDYGENTDFSRSIPPPGLRRMVVGQHESEYTQNLPSDEPPPGLARMVPGQQTESENAYNQNNDNYMDRHVDGGPTDGSGRPYRQAEGQQTSDSYSQPPPPRGNERRPIGLDRMVPGEPSNDDYSQYQGTPYASSNEQRVVTGVDHEYSMPADPGPANVREQNMDGSDYTEQTVRNPSRSVIGARESSNDTSPDFGRPDEQQREQREVVMEGENLQDLSVISSTEITFSREQTFDGADMSAADTTLDRKADAPESLEHSMSGSRRQSLNHANTSGEDSERDRPVKSSPRRDKHKVSRDRERDKEGRYSRGDRKYDRDSDRRPGRDDRERRAERERRDRDHERRDKAESPEARRARRTRERDESPDARRLRRSTRSHRYETEDTDYYSDRDRYQRRQREGSYAGKPPRHDGERRYRDERRDRRYDTAERDAARPRDRDRYEQRYRDIDPSRKYGNLRKEREDERKRGETYSPSRAESREPTATDDEREPRRRERRRHHRNDPYYDAYGAGGAAYGADPYALQRQQYQYYERLRAADPAAYMQLYKMMAQQPHHDLGPHYEGYPGYEAGAARDERGSVHSGRSSATGPKGNDTEAGWGRFYARADAAGSLLDAPSLRTDLSDRDLNTDASLNLHLEESTVRSERMTPFRYSTAHIKGSIASRNLVVVCARYPVDGRPARVALASLQAALAHTPPARALAAYPGPLRRGVTHKKSVIEYCEGRAAGGAARDPVGHALLWELLALLLRQNGVVVGTDIAELLMKNAREHQYNKQSDRSARSESRRESSASGEHEEASPDVLEAPAQAPEYPTAESPKVAAEEAVDRLREYLIYGNRQEALEYAMSQQLWGHALLLSWHGERRARAQAAARFVASLPRADPLHTLYSSLAAKQPPVATCASSAGWGDWRPHAAMVLANTSAKPENDSRTLIQLGDTLSARGLIYSAQFCYISGGVQWARHPLAPLPPPGEAGAAPPPVPRLSLLLADPKATTFAHHATEEAIFATEIYEYALSLNQDYIIKELQVYKLVLATRLVDVGLYERALAYTEQAARAVTRAPADYAPALVHALAELADRLRYHDPLLQEDPPLVEEGEASGEPSPRHQQWLDDVKNVADALTASAHSTPQHAPAPQYYAPPAQYDWHEQAQQQQYQQPPPPAPAPACPEPAEESPEYAQYYAPQPEPYQPEPAPAQPYPYYDDGYGWQNQRTDHYGYGELPAQPAEAETAAEGAPAEAPRPMITMPGASAGGLYGEYDDDRPPSADTDRETETPKTDKKDSKPKDGKDKGSGWLGGILTRLSLRAPNQMILPDDKNPSIVWDPDTKRWKNLDADDDEQTRPPPPPPKTHELAPALAAAAAPSPPLPAPGLAAPPAAPVATSNIFKMQKGRHIKKSYVDVFNPHGAATRALPPAADVLPPAPQPLAPGNYFVPAPTHQVIEFPPSPRFPLLPVTSSPLPSPRESGIYEQSQIPEDDTLRSGI